MRLLTAILESRCILNIFRDTSSIYLIGIWLVVLNLQASWTEARQKLEKDPLSRACNPDIDTAEMERIFREHVDELYNVNISSQS